MNLTILTGRLTKAVDLKSTKNGKPCVQFDLAVESDFKDKNTNKYITTFIPCICYSHQAQFMNKYMEKGQLVEVQGYIYSNRNNGTFFTNVVVRNIKGLEIPKSRRNANQQPFTEQSSNNVTNNNDFQKDNNFNHDEVSPYSFMGSMDPSFNDELPF